MQTWRMRVVIVGVPGEADLVARDDNNENDTAVGNACVHNLFDRFAASSPARPTGHAKQEPLIDSTCTGDNKRKKEHVVVGVVGATTRECHRGGGAPPSSSTAGVDGGRVLSEIYDNNAATRAPPRCPPSSVSSALARHAGGEKEGEGGVNGSCCPDSKAFPSHGLRDASERNDRRVSKDEGGSEDTECRRGTGGEEWAAPKMPAVVVGASVAAAAAVAAAVDVGGHRDDIFARFVYTS